MSDCRVPTATYAKDLIKSSKSEEYKDKLPPIPEGWMAMYYSNANMTTTRYEDMGVNETVISSSNTSHILNHRFTPKMTSTLDVLILVREHK